MSVRVTVDLFSGRPNPSWELTESAAHNVLRRISRRKAMIDDSEKRPDRLGYRGVEIDVLDEGLALQYGLPPSLRIASGAALDDEAGFELAVSLVENLLDSPSVEESAETEAPLDEDLRGFLLEQLTSEFPPSPSVELAPEPEEGEPPPISAECAYDVYAFVPGNWNDGGWIQYYNNCYNFATGRRTDTFAQPGRYRYGSAPAAGDMSCGGISYRTKGDGAHVSSDCFPSTQIPRLLIALVIWPGRDYHYYKKTSAGYWAHKPGHQTARNYDNLSSTIWNPYGCSRTPYTSWCGYFLTAKSMRIR